jgi:hypothetical protein
MQCGTRARCPLEDVVPLRSCCLALLNVESLHSVRDSLRPAGHEEVHGEVRGEGVMCLNVFPHAGRRVSGMLPQARLRIHRLAYVNPPVHSACDLV